MKILIVKTSALGDIIHCFPVIEYLKKYYLRCEIDWVVESPFKNLLDSHPSISNTVEINTKLWRARIFSLQTLSKLITFRKVLRQKSYDLVIDLQGNTKSGIITFLSRAKEKIGFGWNSCPEILNMLATNKRFNPPQGLNIREDYLFLVKQYHNDPSDADYSPCILEIDETHQQHIQTILTHRAIQRDNCIMICPGSSWKNKQLTNETLIDFLKQIHEKEKHCSWLLIWGTDQEKEDCKNIQRAFPDHSLIIEKLNLATLQNLMSKVRKVIAMDSLPLHLAESAGVPTFSFFGPSSAAKYRPLGILHQSFQGACPYNKKFIKRCPILRKCPTGACMRAVNAKNLAHHYLQV